LSFGGCLSLLFQPGIQDHAQCGEKCKENQKNESEAQTAEKMGHRSHPSKKNMKRASPSPIHLGRLGVQEANKYLSCLPVHSSFVSNDNGPFLHTVAGSSIASIRMVHEMHPIL